MNGQALAIIRDAAVFRGELHRMLLAAGVVLLILFLLWAIEEFRMRKSANALGWLGLSCLLLIGMGAGVLIAVGLI